MANKRLAITLLYPCQQLKKSQQRAFQTAQAEAAEL